MEMQVTRSKWFLPLFSVALGFVMLAAMWIGGDLSTGLQSLAIMTVFGALDPLRRPQRNRPRSARRRAG